MALVALGLLLALDLSFPHERDTPVARVTVHAERTGCTVELDAAPVGKTNLQGELVLSEVDPTDHYIHVRCPGQLELTYFVSPHAGGEVEIRLKPASGNSPDGPEGRLPPMRSALETAQMKIQLRQLVLKAVQLRASGRFEEAVQSLHEATEKDPENSDLHRELGITFLMSREWKRARVEMLEAIKHDPSDADAHNGLGYALEKLGELDSAVKEYRIATRLDPDDPSYRQHYVDALGKLALRQEEKRR